ncbi:MAG: hypothetical protein Q4P25_05760, partial [Tissierellia bacterium]|nr:hypothetical protein [Tissierellia bacterium]
GLIYRNIEAFDPCQILLEDKLTDRLYVKKGSNYNTIIKQIVQSANIFKIQLIDNDYKVSRDREFELGTPKIDVVNELLSEINYTNIYSDETGTLIAKPYILPVMREIQHIYKVGIDAKIIYNTIKDDVDLFNLPNVFIGIVSNSEETPIVSKYINSNPASPISTVSRNRNIVEVINVNDIANDKILDGYIKRVAYEKSNGHSNVEFETLNEPNHSYGDCIYLEEKELNISHKYIEMEWSMDLTAGGKMKHKARRIIIL